MKKLFTLVAGLAVFGLAALLSLGLTTPAPAGNEAAQVATTTKTVTFKIANMTCAACPITVRAAMQGVKGVASVKVDFATKTALVVFDPGMATIDAIAAASTNAGYPATAQEPAKGS
jgi:periplasmic mercuric ion binding protein